MIKSLQKLSLLLFAGLGMTIPALAQTKIGFNPGTIDPSSLLELEHPNKALLITRVSLVNTSDLTTVPNPKAGMVVYNTNTSIFAVNPSFTASGAGLYYFDGTGWVYSGIGTFAQNFWSLNGNSNAVDGTNFIGTTNNVAFNIRVNNQKSGRIDLQGNTSLGYQAGSNQSIGLLNNTLIGSSAGSGISTGSSNTAVGSSALLNTGLGFNNTALGYRAGANFADAHDNTFIGNQTDITNSAVNGSTVIGSGATVSQSNSVILGNAAASVGIGNTAPSNKLHVTGTNPLRLEGLQGIATSDSVLSSDATGVVKKLSTAAVIANIKANNGLTRNNDSIQLGGNLTHPTTIAQGGNNLTFSGGDVAIGGNTTTSGNASVGGNSSTTGNTTTTGSTTSGSFTTTGATNTGTLGASGNATIGGTLGVTGNTTIGGNTTVTGNTTSGSFTTSGNTTTGTLRATGLTAGNSADSLLNINAATGVVSKVSPVSIIGNIKANNGLTRNADSIQLGGTLSHATNVDQAGNNLTITNGNVGFGTAAPANNTEFNYNNVGGNTTGEVGQGVNVLTTNAATAPLAIGLRSRMAVTNPAQEVRASSSALNVNNTVSNAATAGYFNSSLRTGGALNPGVNLYGVAADAVMSGGTPSNTTAVIGGRFNGNAATSVTRSVGVLAIAEGSTTANIGAVGSTTSNAGTIAGALPAGTNAGVLGVSGTGTATDYAGYFAGSVVATGNVGIGNNAPTNKLHVTGTNPLRLEGLQPLTTAADSVLTKDATGVVKTTSASSIISNIKANNGLTRNNDSIQLGGQLTHATTVDQNGNALNFTNGNIAIGGNTTTTGTATAGNLTTAGATNTGTLNATGNAAVGGTLGVTGTTISGNFTTTGATNTGTLGTSGNATIGGTAAITGNTTIGGNLGVTGTTTSGNVISNGNTRTSTLTATGITNGNTADSVLNINGAGVVSKISSSAITANIKANNGLTRNNDSIQLGGQLTHATTVDQNNNNLNFTNGNIAIGGNTTTSGNASVGGNSNTTGSTTSGSFNTTGATNTGTLNATGNTTIGGNTTVTGNTTSGSFTTSGNTTTGTLRATGLTAGNSADSLLNINAATGVVSKVSPVSIIGNIKANNGLTRNADSIQLGGTLSHATNVDQAGNNLTITNGNVGFGTAAPANNTEFNYNNVGGNTTGEVGQGVNVLTTNAATAPLAIGLRSRMAVTNPAQEVRASSSALNVNNTVSNAATAGYFNSSLRTGGALNPGVNLYGVAADAVMSGGTPSNTTAVIGGRFNGNAATSVTRSVGVLAIAEGSTTANIGAVGSTTSNAGTIAGALPAGTNAGVLGVSGTGTATDYAGYFAGSVVATGNVGIGNNAPTNKLHVTGTNPLRLEGLQPLTTAADSVLTKDATGVVKTTSASSIISNIKANNGLTRNNDSIQLGGTLSQPTTIYSDATNTLTLRPTGIGGATNDANQGLTVLSTSGNAATAIGTRSNAQVTPGTTVGQLRAVNGTANVYGTVTGTATGGYLNTVVRPGSDISAAGTITGASGDVEVLTGTTNISNANTLSGARFGADAANATAARTTGVTATALNSTSSNAGVAAGANVTELQLKNSIAAQPAGFSAGVYGYNNSNAANNYAAYFNGNAATTGNTTIGGTLNVTNNTTSGSFTTAGNTTTGTLSATALTTGGPNDSLLNIVNGVVHVTTPASITATIKANNGLTRVADSIQLGGTLTHSTTIAQNGNALSLSGGTLAVSEPATTTGVTNTGNVATTTLNVTGASTTTGITNTGNVGTTTLNTTGAATVGGTLGVTSATTLNGGATVNNGSTLNGGNVLNGGNTLNGGTAVTNLTSGTINDSLVVADPATGTLRRISSAQISNVVKANNGLTRVADSIQLGGTLAHSTTITQNGNSLTLAGGPVNITGATATNGITNTGNITNSGLTQTGTLNVTGASTTTGITNAGNVGTTTLNVTGASTTNGIANTGNVTTNTLTATGLTTGAPTDSLVTVNNTTGVINKRSINNVVTASNGLTANNGNITLGGQLTNNTFINTLNGSSVYSLTLQGPGALTVGGNISGQDFNSNGNATIQGNTVTNNLTALNNISTYSLKAIGLPTGAAGDSIVTIDPTSGFVHKRNINSVVTASNGLTANGGNVTLGGTLSGPTTIAQAGNNLALSGGTVSIGGNTTITGNVVTNGNDTTTGASSTNTLAVVNGATIGGNLAVTGNTTSGSFTTAGNTTTGTLRATGLTATTNVGDSLLNINPTTGVVSKVSPAAIIANIRADNGLTRVGDSIELGGTLKMPTTVNQNGNALSFTNGNISIGGNTTTSGTATANNFTTAGLTNTGTLNVTGASTTTGITNTGNVGTGTLSTTGAATVGTTLNVTNNTTSGSFTTTGNTTTGTLTATNLPAGLATDNIVTIDPTTNVVKRTTINTLGAITTASNGLTKVGNDVQFGGTLAHPTTVDQAGNALSFANGDISIGGNTATSGNATVGGTLGVTGATTTNGITNTGNVGTGTLSTTGAATVGTTLGVGGNTTIGGTLNVTNNTTSGSFTTTGNTTTGTLTATALPAGAGTDDIVTIDPTTHVVNRTNLNTLGAITTASNGLSKVGNDVQLGGTLTHATTVYSDATNTLTLRPTGIGGTTNDANQGLTVLSTSGNAATAIGTRSNAQVTPGTTVGQLRAVNGTANVYGTVTGTATGGYLNTVVRPGSDISAAGTITGASGDVEVLNGTTNISNANTLSGARFGADAANATAARTTGVTATALNSTSSNAGVAAGANVTELQLKNSIAAQPAGFSAGVYGYNNSNAANNYAAYFNGNAATTGNTTIGGTLNVTNNTTSGSFTTAGNTTTGTLTATALPAGLATDNIVTIDPATNIVKRTTLNTLGGITTASNGLTKVGNDVQLGGTLTGNTTIAQAGNNLTLSGGTVTISSPLTTAGITTTGNTTTTGNVAVTGNTTNTGDVTTTGATTTGTLASGNTVITGSLGVSGNTTSGSFTTANNTTTGSLTATNLPVGTASDSLVTIDPMSGVVHRIAVNRIVGTVMANNGLSKSGDTVQLGGTLNKNTTIDGGNFNTTITSSSATQSTALNVRANPGNAIAAGTELFASDNRITGNSTGAGTTTLRAQYNNAQSNSNNTRVNGSLNEASAGGTGLGTTGTPQATGATGLADYTGATDAPTTDFIVGLRGAAYTASNKTNGLNVVGVNFGGSFYRSVGGYFFPGAGSDANLGTVGQIGGAENQAWKDAIFTGKNAGVVAINYNAPTLNDLALYTRGNVQMDALPAGLATDNIVTIDPATNIVKRTTLNTLGGITTASNGLTKVGNDVQLGGTLTGNTTIAQAGNNLTLSGGTVTISSPLTTAGITTTGNTTTTGNVAVTGNTTNTGDVTTTGATTTGTLASGNTVITGSLGVSGNTTSGSFTTTGNTTTGTLTATALPAGAGTDDIVTIDPTTHVVNRTNLNTLGAITTASNGLSKVGNDVQLGGTLTHATTVYSDATNTLTLRPTGIGGTTNDANQGLTVLSTSGNAATAIGTRSNAQVTPGTTVGQLRAVNGTANVYGTVTGTATGGYLNTVVRPGSDISAAGTITGASGDVEVLNGTTNISNANTLSGARFGADAANATAARTTGVTATALNSTSSNAGVAAGANVTELQLKNSIAAQPAGFSAGVYGYNNSNAANNYAAYFNGNAATTGNTTIGGTLNVTNNTTSGSFTTAGNTTTGTLTATALPAGLATDNIVTIDPATNIVKRTTLNTLGGITTASNGLTKVGNDVQLGGTLTGNTTIAQAGNNLTLSGGTVTISSPLTTAGITTTGNTTTTGNVAVTGNTTNTGDVTTTGATTTGTLASGNTVITGSLGVSGNTTSGSFTTANNTTTGSLTATNLPVGTASDSLVTIDPMSGVVHRIAVNRIVGTVMANNGLSKSGDTVQLGGTLNKNTTIDGGNFNTTITSSSATQSTALNVRANPGNAIAAGTELFASDNRITGNSTGAGTTTLRAQYNNAQSNSNNTRVNGSLNEASAGGTGLGTTGTPQATGATGLADYTGATDAPTTDFIVGLRGAAYTASNKTNGLNVVGVNFGGSFYRSVGGYFFPGAGSDANLGTVGQIGGAENQAWKDAIFTGKNAGVVAINYNAPTLNDLALYTRGNVQMDALPAGLATDNIVTIDPTTNIVKRTTLNTLGGITTASNGLTKVGNDVQLGGTLTQATTVNQNNLALSFTNGDISIGGNTTTGGTATANNFTTTGATQTGTLAVSGASTTHGITNTGNVGTGTLSTTGAATVGTTLGVTGATTTNTLNVTGIITGAATDNIVTVNPTTGLINSRSINSVVTASNGLTATNGNVTLGGSLTNATTIVTNGNSVTLQGAGSLNVGGDVNAQNLSANGNAVINGNTTTGNLTANNNTTTGTLKINNITAGAVTDDIVTIDAATGFTHKRSINSVVTASNGLTANNGNVTLGGTLSGATTIAQAGNNLTLSGGTVTISSPLTTADITTTGNTSTTGNVTVTGNTTNTGTVTTSGNTTSGSFNTAGNTTTSSLTVTNLAAGAATDSILSELPGGVVRRISAQQIIGNIVTDPSLTGAGTTASPLKLNTANPNTFSATQTLPTTAAQGNNLIGAVNLGTAGSIAAAQIGTGLTNAQVNDDLTINGGTVNNTPIGAGTANTGDFTALTATGATVNGNATVTGTDVLLTNINGGGSSLVTIDPTTGKLGKTTAAANALSLAGNGLRVNTVNPAKIEIDPTYSNSFTAPQTFSSAAINGGTLDAVTITNSPISGSTGSFTGISSAGLVKFSGLTGGGTDLLTIDPTTGLVGSMANPGYITTVHTDGTSITGNGSLASPVTLNTGNANTFTATQTLPANATQGNNLATAINAGTAGNVNAAQIGNGLTDAQVSDNLTINTANAATFTGGAAITGGTLTGSTITNSPISGSTGSFTGISSTGGAKLSGLVGTGTDLLTIDPTTGLVGSMANPGFITTVHTDGTSITGDGSTANPVTLNTGNANTFTAAQTFNGNAIVPANATQGNNLIAAVNAGTTNITDAHVADNLTINGGVIDGSVIGGTTQAAASVTTLNTNGNVKLTNLGTTAATNLVGIDATGNLSTLAIPAVVTADNGLTKTGNNIQLGGPLTQNTDVALNSHNLTISNATATTATYRNDGTIAMGNAGPLYADNKYEIRLNNVGGSNTGGEQNQGVNVLAAANNGAALSVATRSRINVDLNTAVSGVRALQANVGIDGTLNGGAGAIFFNTNLASGSTLGANASLTGISGDAGSASGAPAGATTNRFTGGRFGADATNTPNATALGVGASAIGSTNSNTGVNAIAAIVGASTNNAGIVTAVGPLATVAAAAATARANRNAALVAVNPNAASTGTGNTERAIYSSGGVQLANLGTTTATNLVGIDGAGNLSTLAIPAATTANNGLTAAAGNIQLGGTLVNANTTIATTGTTNTLSITGLTGGSPSTNLIVGSTITGGVIDTRTLNSIAGSGLNAAGTNGALQLGGPLTQNTDLTGAYNLTVSDASAKVGIGTTIPTTTLQVKGSASYNVNVVATPPVSGIVAIAPNDYFVELGTTGNTFAGTVTLPDPAAYPGRILIIKNRSSSILNLNTTTGQNNGLIYDNGSTSNTIGDVGIPSRVYQIMSDGAVWQSILN